MSGAEADLTGPRLRTNLEIFDFGYVPQHAQIAHAFWLKNVGTEKAIITKVQTNCGCTQAPLEDSVVAVGDSTWIEVILGTGRMIGPVEKYTRVEGSAIGRIPSFTIQAHVLSDTSQRPPISVEPADAFIDPDDLPGDVGSVWEYPLTFRNETAAAATVSAIAVPGEFVRLAEKSFNLPPGGSHRIVLYIVPAVMDQPFSKSITFESSGRMATRLTVPFGKRPEY